MQKKRDLIENLTVVRTFTLEDEGMPELVDAIGKRGQRMPILVYDGNVVDGARRVSALRILGLEAADTDVAEDLFEVVETMGAAAKKQPPTIDRIVDLLTIVAPYTSLRTTRPGGRDRWYKLHPELPLLYQWGRQMLAYATGYVLSESAIVRLSYLLSRAKEGNKIAAEMLADIRAGRITAHQGKLATENAETKLTGPTKTGAEQRRVLANGIANLDAAVQVFATLGAPLRVSDEEVADTLTALRRIRFTLYTLVREIKKEQSRKENSSA